MVNIALAPNTASHLTTHMLLTMHFSLVPGPNPDITAHVLDMVLSHIQVEYHSQDTHIPHHLRPLLGSRDRIALILVIRFQSHHLILVVCLVRLMVQCLWAWELVPHTALHCQWMSLRLIQGQT